MNVSDIEINPSFTTRCMEGKPTVCLKMKAAGDWNGQLIFFYELSGYLSLAWSESSSSQCRMSLVLRTSAQRKSQRRWALASVIPHRGRSIGVA